MPNLKRTTVVCATVLTVAFLCGCSGWEEIDYHDNSEIPQGPGLISGNKGGWTIFRVEEKTPRKQEEDTGDKTE